MIHIEKRDGSVTVDIYGQRDDIREEMVAMLVHCAKDSDLDELFNDALNLLMNDDVEIEDIGFKAQA